jgi:hypothetical protein
VNQVAFKRYKVVRIIFWLTFIGGFFFLFTGILDIFPLLFICAFIASIVSIFMPCPFCGKTIGFRRWGMMTAGNSFGGWCLHCGARLFAVNRDESN